MKFAEQVTRAGDAERMCLSARLIAGDGLDLAQFDFEGGACDRERLALAEAPHAAARASTETSMTNPLGPECPARPPCGRVEGSALSELTPTLVDPAYEHTVPAPSANRAQRSHDHLSASEQLGLLYRKVAPGIAGKLRCEWDLNFTQRDDGQWLGLALFSRPSPSFGEHTPTRVMRPIHAGPGKQGNVISEMRRKLCDLDASITRDQDLRAAALSLPTWESGHRKSAAAQRGPGRPKTGRSGLRSFFFGRLGCMGVGAVVCAGIGAGMLFAELLIAHADESAHSLEQAQYQTMENVP